MREIKFRIWLEPDSRLEYMNLKEPIKSNHIELLRFFENIANAVNYSYINSSGKRLNAILMQYTGLKDKNGKEIYEGDIVKAVYWVDEDGFNSKTSSVEIFYVVVYSDGHINEKVKAGFWTKFLKIGNRTGKYFNEYGNNIGQTTEQDFYKLEVIGNIYENPELLKEKKEI